MCSCFFFCFFFLNTNLRLLLKTTVIQHTKQLKNHDWECCILSSSIIFARPTFFLRNWGLGKQTNVYNAKRPITFDMHSSTITTSKHFGEMSKKLILTQRNMNIEINEQTTLLCLTQIDVKESEKRNTANHISLIVKLTIFKYKYGKV